MSEADRQNIEIKVRLSETEQRRIKLNLGLGAALLGGSSTDVDTYFRVAHGRLKLRVHGQEREGTLIFYERPNEEASRLSHYRLTPIPDAFALSETLTRALGVLVTIRKQRAVRILGSTRVHFDQVEQLGWFIELETVIGTQGYDAALIEHRAVFETLGLGAHEIVPGSYSDLLLQESPA